MLSLKSKAASVLFFTILALVCHHVECQSTEPPPNVRKISKLAKAVQPDLCYSFCETCQSNKYECISCERPYMKSIPPYCNVSIPYQVLLL
jgi:hypothetical protein